MLDTGHVVTGSARSAASAVALERRGALEAVSTRAIAEAIGDALDVPVVSVAPEDSAEHFGFVDRFVGLDMSGSSTDTRRLLSWNPAGPTLIDDIRSGAHGRA